VITVDIVDASVLQLALTYLYTGDYDDAESALAQALPESENTNPKSDGEDIEDKANGSHMDSLLSGGLEDDDDRSEGASASTISYEADAMLTDSGGLSGHERLNPTYESACHCDNHDRKLAGQVAKAACSKGRLETNTLVYILADYIQVPELEALAVRKFAATLEGVCRDGLRDVCYLVYRSAPSTALQLRSCLANSIASSGQELINDTKFMDVALGLPELLRDSFSCVVRQHCTTSDERDAAVAMRLEAENSAKEANERGQEDKQRIITQVNQARRCRHCSLENNVRFEREGSCLGRSDYSFRCTCRTKY
jgi:hypothetical protein